MSLNRSDAMSACEDYDEDGCAWTRREAARIKQIQIGKARPEYQRYVREVQPIRRTPSQPSTPDPRARVSKRQFDRALGDWRRRLHEFDTVPRGPPRSIHGHHSEAEAPWSTGGQSSKSAWGATQNKPELTGAASYGGSQLAETGRNGPRSGNRRARAEPVPPRTTRPGKFGPRKPLDSLEIPEKDSFSMTADPSLLPPPPPPPLANGSQTSPDAASVAPQSGVVRISLADQLMEMPVQPMMQAAPQEWQWYQSPEAQQMAAWGSMETPVKMMGMSDMQFMNMETPIDKPIMPGHAFGQPIYDESMMKADDQYLGMPQEAYMLPHRLFDSTPEKSEHGHILNNEEGSRCNSEELASLESSIDSSQMLEAASVAIELSPSKEAEPPQSPKSRPARDSFMPMMSPCSFASPVPTTPKRQYFVPETPSPDRMHGHWAQHLQQPGPLGLQQPYPHSWNYGVQAQDQGMPEFMQMMQCSMTLPEGQTLF